MGTFLLWFQGDTFNVVQQKKARWKNATPRGLKPEFWRDLAAWLKAVPFPKPARAKIVRQSETGQAPSLHEFFPHAAKPRPSLSPILKRAVSSYFTLRVDSRTISSGTILR